MCHNSNYPYGVSDRDIDALMDDSDEDECRILSYGSVYKTLRERFRDMPDFECKALCHSLAGQIFRKGKEA